MVSSTTSELLVFVNLLINLSLERPQEGLILIEHVDVLDSLLESLGAAEECALLFSTHGGQVCSCH